jgi:hypothetical protein
VFGVGSLCLGESCSELERGEALCQGESGAETDLTGEGGITRGGSGCGWRLEAVDGRGGAN